MIIIMKFKEIMKLHWIILVLSTILILNLDLNSQVKGLSGESGIKDTIFVFQSPRPLIQKDENKDLNEAWGIDILLSGNGFGFGFFYNREIFTDWVVFGSLYLSGARNTDELEYYSYTRNIYFVPNKVNRLYLIPLTIGLQTYLFRNELSDNLKPFINAGIGPSFILKAPYEGYENDFFKSLEKLIYYIRFSTFIGGGVEIGTMNKSLFSVNFRYYLIPFGGEGLESVRDNPIKDFGGLFLSLSIGAKF